MTAMLAGETEITYAAVLSGMQHIKGGRLKALALASGARYPGLPEVPTTAEAGLKGFEIDYWYALIGPAGVSRGIVERIQRDTAAIVTAEETRDSLLAQGSIAVGGTPEELDALIRREYALWAKVVKAGSVKPE
jgi:tripartite-type tricarboxylate transporter receptor subunit TctC